MLAPHGLMFHHFHDEDKHIRCQGSVSEHDLTQLIDYYAKDHNIISADEFLKREINGTIGDEDVCVTFDDGLRCQYDVALPVLRKKGIKAFWFIYSSPLEGEKEKLEIYHHFRFSMYDDIDDYYNAFYDISRSMGYDIDGPLQSFDHSAYLTDSPFYTVEDKVFRYTRDVILGQDNYYLIMDEMIARSGYSIEDNIKELWMDKGAIKKLVGEGHIIGVHSHTHPTRMVDKGYEGQLFEYGHCKDVLRGISGIDPVVAAYPCGVYDELSIRVMKEVGVKLAFNAFMNGPKYGEAYYEIPRMDHSPLMRKLGL